MPFLSEGEIKKKFGDEWNYSESVVKELMDMGFSRQEVTQALELCDGDIQQATNLLMQGN